MCRLTCWVLVALGCGMISSSGAHAQQPRAGLLSERAAALKGQAQMVSQPAPAAAAKGGEALGFAMRADGMVVGRVTMVDPGTFNLVPLQNANVTFVQNRQVLAQGRTAEDGSFAVRGLTPWASYSCLVSSTEWAAAFGVAIRPEADAGALGGGKAAGAEAVRTARAANELQLVSANSKVAAEQPGAGRAFQIQVIPRSDLMLGLGLDGAGMGPPGLAGAGFVGGGGGGGGGGCGGGGGFPAIPFPLGGGNGGFASGFLP